MANWQTSKPAGKVQNLANWQTWQTSYNIIRPALGPANQQTSKLAKYNNCKKKKKCNYSTIILILVLLYI
jgi:hypothetical protein